MGGRYVVFGGFAIGEAFDAKIVIIASTVSASDANLAGGQHHLRETRRSSRSLTVEVISAEQTSQTYLTPPSAPRAAVFLRITPMVASPAGKGPPLALCATEAAGRDAEECKSSARVSATPTAKTFCWNDVAVTGNC